MVTKLLLKQKKSLCSMLVSVNSLQGSNFFFCFIYCSRFSCLQSLVILVGGISRPVFSTDNFSSNKHKMERFLHPGCFSLASIYGPISFPPLPLVVLKISEGSDAPAIAALGSLKSIEPNKIILKKIILTG